MRTFELEPNHYRVNSWLEMAYEKKGLYGQAIELRMKALAIMGPGRDWSGEEGICGVWVEGLLGERA